MKNKNNVLIAVIIIAILLIGGIYLYVSGKNEGTEVVQTEGTVLFPGGGETLIPGNTYVLRWNNPGSMGTTTSIFLVDNALLSQGVSVSIVDRKYGIMDTGSYDYTIPAGISDGTYFFAIGTTISNKFTIASSTASSTVQE